MTPALILFAVSAPVAFWVAWSDLATMTIPNKAVLALIAVFAVAGALVLPFEAYLWRWMHLVIVFLIGLIAWNLGLVGAGDAKYAAGMALFVDSAHTGFFLFLFAGVLLAAFVTHRLAARLPGIRGQVPDWKSWSETRDFPMGLALSGALSGYLLLAGLGIGTASG